MTNSWIVGTLVVALVIVGGVFYFTREGADLPLGSLERSDVSAEEGSGTDETPTPGSSTGAQNQNTVLAVLGAHPELSSFASMVNRSNSRAALATSGQNFTVFAPTNGALALLSRGTLANLSQAELNDLVKNHIVGRRIDVDAVESGSVDTMAGNKVGIEVRDQDNAVLVGSGFVINTYTTGNGVVHVLSSVLLSPEE